MKKRFHHTYSQRILMLAAGSFFLCLAGCKKLVETDPPSNQITQPALFAADASAIGTFNYMYSNMAGSISSYFTGGSNGMTYLTAVSADELTPFGTNQKDFYNNNLIINNNGSNGGLSSSMDLVWTPFYQNIYTCNTAVEEIAKSGSLSVAVKKQLTGEAKFFRALSYFYLTSLFGDVPLALSTDPYVNNTLTRSPQADVYTQIINDLNDAKQLLSADFLNGTLLSPTTERVRPTKWAADALLARTYLYKKDYVKAEEEANAVINNTGLFGPLPALNNVFLKNSPEAIWQIQPTESGYNTAEARFMVLTSSSSNSGYLSSFLLNNVETGDKRFVEGNWVNTISIAPYGSVKGMYKYKVNISSGVSTPTAMTEYFMVLRLGEQYLIRAEARAMQNNISGAQADLNAIRNRAGLANTLANDQSSLATAILKERQMELFCEAGHRWFDLRRTGTIDAVMGTVTPQKSGGLPWQPYQALYPIPVGDIFLNGKLTQNPGY